MNYTEIAKKHGATQLAQKEPVVFYINERQLTAYSKEIERMALERAMRSPKFADAWWVREEIRKLIEELEK